MRNRNPKIKICGITRPEEIAYLNELNVDYAGFVFYPKSRRNVSVEQAEALMRQLKPGIKKVAVVVSPDLKQLEYLNELPVDIVQIHGILPKELLPFVKKEIWQAVNITTERTYEMEESQNIGGYVLDGATYGGGKTFDWSLRPEDAFGTKFFEKIRSRTVVLAGGLNADNVQQGVRLFEPDVVDVSSGVEGSSGKDRMKIEQFIRKVRNDG